MNTELKEKLGLNERELKMLETKIGDFRYGLIDVMVEHIDQYEQMIKEFENGFIAEYWNIDEYKQVLRDEIHNGRFLLEVFKEALVEQAFRDKELY